MMEAGSSFEIVIEALRRLLPVLIILALIAAASVALRRRLGLYGRLWGSAAGVCGLIILMFWVLVALLATQIAPFGPLEQIPIMKDKPPGTIEPASGEMYLFGGDRLARDVFSRVMHGSSFVLAIAPVAGLFALIFGVCLGLPAGYFGGRVDAVLSFLANLVLAFPVILIFYLLVSPGVGASALPQLLGGVVLGFTIIALLVAITTRFAARPEHLWPLVALCLGLGGWAFAGLVFDADPSGLLSVPPNVLNIFVAVVLVAFPGIFRVVRGLTMDVRTRDYIAAAMTRGERPVYIMLWEILPNIRGPLIVDFCLRIGFTAIMLGTLGFFGLGLDPESPDWGTSIKDGSALLRLYVWPALFPALALMSLVLGLNLLADALREQSLDS